MQLGTTERDSFLRTILKIFESRGKASDFLISLVKRDVESVIDPAVLFRLNSGTTKGLFS